ncbi:MAG: DUF7385 family protein [Halobacteriota archaeon]
MEDFEELVSSLTPTEHAGGVRSYRNTVSIACPACGEPFDDLVVCEEELTSLELSMPLDLCAGAHDGKPVLFTHKP